MPESVIAEPPHWRSRPTLLAKKYTATLTILTLLMGLIIVGVEPANAAEEDHSEAYSQLIDGDLIGVDLADVGASNSAFPSSPDPRYNPLDVALLNEAAQIDLGGGLQLPLVGEEGEGLLQLGQLGLIHSYAHADHPTRAVASAGTITEDGAIAVDPSQETGDPARVDLTMLLNQLNVEGLTDAIIDEAGLNIGALASRAESDSGNLTRDYAIADLSLNVSSPLIDGLTEDLGDVVEGVGTTLNAALDENGVLGSTISSLEVIDIDLRPLARIGVTEAKLGLNGVDEALNTVSNEVLQGTITSDTGLVSVHLDTGTITLNLEHLVTGGLNEQPANTSLIHAETLQLITAELSLVLNNLVADLLSNLTLALEQIELVVDLDLEARLLFVTLATGGAQITGSLADFFGSTGESPTIDIDLDLAGLSLGDLLNPLLSGVVGVLSGAVGALLGSLLDGIEDTLDSLIAAVLTPLSPVLSRVVEQLLQVTLNEQGTTVLSGHEAHSVTALSVTLLPLTQAVDLKLATATVRALDDYADVVITSPEDGQVIWGDEIEVNGTAHPGVDVTVELAGQTTTVTADESGSWSAPFTDVSRGEHTATATDEVTTDTVDFVVRVPVEITAPADDEVLGDVVPVVGTAAPNTDVTVTLCVESTDCPAEDSPTRTTQTDGEGNWAVEFSGVPAGQYTALAADTYDSDEVIFSVLYVPAIQLEPDTVNPGSTTTITGQGFAPGEEVVITLPDGERDGQVISGTEVTTTANDNGDLSADLETPAQYPTGAIEISAAGPISNTPATATLTVVAPVVITSPDDGDVFSGATVPITGTAEPGVDVTVSFCVQGDQCPDEDAPVRTVPVDDSGNWSAEFEDVTAGQYTVDATDGIAQDSVDITVPAAFEMPLTGGVGQWSYLIFGGLALMLALGIGVVHHRRKGTAHQPQP